MATDKRRRLPSVSRLLDREDVQESLSRLPRELVVTCLRSVIESARASGNGSDPELIARDAIRKAEAQSRQSLCRAINATGIVLHTGLGRAVLCEQARRAVEEVARGHSVLEVESESGRRGSRQAHVQALLRELTGADDGLVVNNNAGAVLLAVTALAAGREVIISRGELVEIGGAFRVPDIIRASGAALVEVGTTNRTRIKDFEEAITDRTALLLRCHPSNFRLIGFTQEVPLADLSALGRARGIPVLDDLGSGALADTSPYAGATTTLRQSVASGSDVVTASGDKLLGGPQAGILVGRSDLVERIARHPLARALRVDKMTMAALEATLRVYRDPGAAWREIPTLRYLSRDAATLRSMALRLGKSLTAAAEGRLTVDLVEEESQVGGGSLPGENLPTTCVRISPTEPGRSADGLAAALRRADSPVFARVKAGSVLLDVRTLEESEFDEIACALRAALE